MKTWFFPPWGTLSKEHVDELEGANQPIGWLSSPNAYVDWRDKLVGDIAENIWPEYCSLSHRWIGNASSSMQRLTEADFFLQAELFSKLCEPIGRGGGSSDRTHGQAFSSEDLSFIGNEYRYYDPLIALSFEKQIEPQIGKGMIEKCGSISLQLKQRFQRPRPYQISIIADEKRYRHLTATTANTPSLVSGHALMALIGCCSAYRALRHDTACSTDFDDCFAQFAADVGDRRVMAGVHYPSDSIASWYVGFALIPLVFDEPADVLAFARLAIFEKSSTYSAISKHVAANEQSPFQPALQLLRNAAYGRK